MNFKNSFNLQNLYFIRIFGVFFNIHDLHKIFQHPIG